MGLKNFTIFGERCSGTNFLAHAMLNNFNLPLVWDYGYKHFYGHNSFKGQKDTLFLCIVRHPLDWINSLYRSPHHLRYEMRFNRERFLSLPVVSYKHISPSATNNGDEIIEDRNMHTKEHYKNIFELRETKLDYIVNHIPKKVDNFYMIALEDLQSDYFNEMGIIEELFNLTIKDFTIMPVPNYKGGDVPYNPNRQLHNEFSLSDIKPSLNLRLEQKFFDV